MKKKKKKKKIDFENIEDGGGAEPAVTVPEAKVATDSLFAFLFNFILQDEPTPEPVNDTNFDDELLLKKKKKKKKVFDMSDLKDGLVSDASFPVAIFLFRRKAALKKTELRLLKVRTSMLTWTSR